MARRKSKLAASHQRSWLWGRHAVVETLTAGRWPVLEILASDGLHGEVLQIVQQHASNHSVRFEVVSPERIQQITGAADHQGLAARMAEYPAGDMSQFAAFLAETPSNRSFPLIVVCDCIQDAHNFGAILRCCDGVKADAVVVGEHYQAGITPHVARSSAGAVNHVRIFRLPLLSEAINALQQQGFQIAAASEKAEQPHWSQNLNCPTALIIGSESVGISPELLERSDVHLRIPMMGSIESLNAAVAAGILLYEIRRQQQSY